MAITKIHPIKKTLNLAIDYITNEDKTDEQILVSSFGCNPDTAHLQFQNTRDVNKTRGTVLAHHLIQSFYPGEVTPEKAHEIAKELVEKMLKDSHEYVIATHVDKGHIHSHIIFNNVNFKTGRCYKSNTKSYHRIRTISDSLCRKNHLIVIDEHYEAYKRKYKTRGSSWYEYQQKKAGKSWKSKLQFDIDRAIKKAKDFDDFLKVMDSFGYDNKTGKHIAFKKRDGQKRFTRAMRIGEDYTEDRIRERIDKEVELKSKRPKAMFKPVKSVIDINANDNIKSSPGYEFWATKHNLNTMADTINQVRNEGYKSRKELEEALKKSATRVQKLLTENKEIEKQIEQKMKAMENRHTIEKYKQIYQCAKSNPDDDKFLSEYSSEIALYKAAVEDSFKDNEVLPTTKQLLKELDELNSKHQDITDKLNEARIEKDRLFKYKKNYDTYLGKEQER